VRKTLAHKEIVMRLFKVAALGAALGLSGCIDVDMTAEIVGQNEARVTGFMQVQREMLDMMGGTEGFCNADDGGTLEMTDTHARCNMLMEGTFDEIFTEDEEGAPSPEITDLGDGTVRVTFPIGAATSDMAEMRSDPQMAAMMRPMLEGHTFTIRIRGAQIISSNGEIAADGLTASYSFPLVQVLDENAVFPETFEAVVRY
jgi:flagellar motor switch/type III secretory pathway protein FliN